MKQFRYLSFLVLFFFCSSCMSTSPKQIFEEAVNNTEYLADCRNKYPTEVAVQEGFQGIYPGRTTTVELVNQFGQPDKYSVINKTEDEYLYIGEELNDNPSYVYNFGGKQNMVDTIYVYLDKEIILPLQGVLEKHGCPDIIIAMALNDGLRVEEILEYNKIFLIYLDAGLQMRFEDYPVSLSDIPSHVAFVKPISLQDFLTQESDLRTGFFVDEYAMPVSFSDAFK